MSHVTAGKFCVYCGEHRLFVKERTNHVLHLLLCLITAGLWGFVWVLMGVVNLLSPYRCSKCGSEEAPPSSRHRHFRDEEDVECPASMTGSERKDEEPEFPWVKEGR